MREEACELLQMYPSEFDSGSFVSAWEQDSDDTSLLFGLFTTKSFEVDVIEPTDNLVIISEEVSETLLLETVPETIDDRVNLEFSVDLSDDGMDSFNQNRQPRVCRRTSQEMEGFGIEYPAVCVEYWPVSNSENPIDEESEVALRDSLKEHFSVDLDKYSGYVGTIVSAIEDRRARIRFNESEGELVRRLREEGVELDDDEILDLYEDWIVEAGSVSIDNLDLTLRREEYGQLLNEKSVSLDDSNRVSREDAIDFIRSNQSASSNSLVVLEDSKERYELPDIPAIGASDIILKITSNGALLDEYTMPVLRQINFDINIGPNTSPSQSADSPDVVFESSDYAVGQYSWDQRLAFSGESDMENWIVEEDSDYDDVMDVVHGLLSGTVKLVDPYLRPGRLSDLIEEATCDVNLWVITALPSNEMQNKRSDFESVVSTADQNGKDLHILWVPNSPTPLHDRFLLSEEQSLTFGTSFNSLQDNLTVVHEISEEKAESLEQNFDYWWKDTRFNNENDVEMIDSTY